MKSTLPDELTALNIRAWMHTHLHVCGCAELDEVAKSLQWVLRWASDDGDEDERYDKADYRTLFPDVGGFYILSGVLQEAGVIWHGVSCRYPDVTEDGIRLLGALDQVTGKQINNAKGVAYDGITYQ